MPSGEYRAWTNHLTKGAAWQIRIPILLAQIATLLDRAAFDRNAKFSKYAWWIDEEKVVGIEIKNQINKELGKHTLEAFADGRVEGGK